VQAEILFCFATFSYLENRSKQGGGFVDIEAYTLDTAATASNTFQNFLVLFIETGLFLQCITPLKIEKGDGKPFCWYDSNK
jgi:hypothetical protein